MHLRERPIWWPFQDARGGPSLWHNGRQPLTSHKRRYFHIACYRSQGTLMEQRTQACPQFRTAWKGWTHIADARRSPSFLL